METKHNITTLYQQHIKMKCLFVQFFFLNIDSKWWLYRSCHKRYTFLFDFTKKKERIQSDIYSRLFYIVGTYSILPIKFDFTFESFIAFDMEVDQKFRAALRKIDIDSFSFKIKIEKAKKNFIRPFHFNNFLYKIVHCIQAWDVYCVFIHICIILHIYYELYVRS